MPDDLESEEEADELVSEESPDDVEGGGRSFGIFFLAEVVEVP